MRRVIDKIAVCVLACLAFVITAPALATGSAPPTPPFLLTWGVSGSGDGEFSSPHSMAADASGNIYVADSGNSRIQKFTSSGVFITNWGVRGSGDGQFSNPQGVAVDPWGYVYVMDSGNNRVQKFTSDGGFITNWGGVFEEGSQFLEARGLAVDASGNVYVADMGNGRIQKFTGSGTFIARWGTRGFGDGEFAYPMAVAVDASGNVYVADSSNNRIQKFDSTGGFVTKWGAYGQGDSQFNQPQGLTIDSSGNVYVADSGNNRIQKFTGDGGFITGWGDPGSDNGLFNQPCGVAIDPSGNVYVADTGNNRIQVFGYPPPPPPVVTTNSADNITVTSARLGGSLTDLGLAASVNVSFQWGPGSGNYTSETTPVSMNTSGLYSYALTGLSANTTYHFRAKAVGDGTAYGNDTVFFTQAAPPAGGDVVVLTVYETIVVTDSAAVLPPVSLTVNENIAVVDAPSLDPPLIFVVFSPVDIQITDPDGLIISKTINQIPGASYAETDINGDGDPDDAVTITVKKTGHYLITLVAESGASLTDTYTLKVFLSGATVVLAEHSPVSGIPAGGYHVTRDEGGIHTNSVMSFSIEKMTIDYSRQDDRDSINTKASFALPNEFTFDPTRDAVTFNIDGVAIAIPAGSFKGNNRESKYSYDSPRGVEPNVSATLDFKTGKVTLVVKKANVDLIDNSDGVIVAFSIGSITGMQDIKMFVNRLTYSYVSGTKTATTFVIERTVIDFGRQDDRDSINVKASFPLPVGATFDPAKDAAKLTIDGIVINIPAGSFKGNKKESNYSYDSPRGVDPNVSATLNFKTGEVTLVVQKSNVDLINNSDGVVVTFSDGFAVNEQTINMYIDSLAYPKQR